MHYDGWATPSDHQHPDGSASSYHIVLNEVFFGDLSRSGGHWTISEQRPHELVQEAAKALTSQLSHFDPATGHPLQNK